MRYTNSNPYLQMDNPALISLLKTPKTEPPPRRRRSSSSIGLTGILKMFKLLPMLTSGCKMVTLLNRPRRASLPDRAITGTIFGSRAGKMTLAIQQDPNSAPMFVIELPMLTAAFQKELESDTVRMALESETRSKGRRVMEEFVWTVFCNGRKIGYAIRRSSLSEEEAYVMARLRGVSMGAGVLPEGDISYVRLSFERVVGSTDSEALYMINPEGATGGIEFSIFFLRGHNV